MEKQTTKFNKVFEKINFSNSIKNNMNNVDIHNISFDKHNKRLNIFATSSSIVNESSVQKIKKEIKEHIKYVEDVNFVLSYENIQKFDEIIGNYWGNILDSIRLHSPVSHTILSTATWKYEDESINIQLTQNNCNLLKIKNVDKSISGIIKERFDVTIPINFIATKIFEEDEYKKNHEKRTQELIQNFEKSREGIVSTTTKEPSKPTQQNTSQNKYQKPKKRSGFKINEQLNVSNSSIKDELIQDNEITVSGVVFEIEERELRNGKVLVSADIEDKYSAATFKFFATMEEYDEIKPIIKKGNSVVVKGYVQFDEYTRELNIMAKEINKGEVKKEVRQDLSEEKRVELHLHTNMSAMDAVTNIKEYVKRAEQFGHKALAITDHGVVQAFPDAMHAVEKKDFKIIYGVEAYLLDDTEIVVKSDKGQSIDDVTYVVFDLETTGLHNNVDRIIEIGAVKVKDGVVVDEFSTLVNPNMQLSEKIKELTHIDDKMLIGQPNIEDVLPSFIEFIEGCVLVAHNASFDVNFVNKNCKDVLGENIDNTVIDTVSLAQTLLPDLKNYKLNTISEYFEVSLENHHRAVDDSKATVGILMKLLDLAKEANVTTFTELNEYATNNIDYKKLRPSHAILLVQNLVGLRNLYELVSIAHLEHYFRRPRIPKTRLNELREGIIVGSACEAGELYKHILENRPQNQIDKILDYYDYYEIQPLDNNMYLVRNQIVSGKDRLMEINEQIVEYGEQRDKLVVATCDVHFIDKDRAKYRSILMDYENFKDADEQAPLYFRTTNEMLKEFDYLGEATAYEVVVTNTNKINDMIEKILPVPDGTFPPVMDTAEEDLKEITYKKAKEMYGDTLPNVVSERLERELNSIISNGFAVMYIIAQKLVWNSLENGYLVGSRGSVGSSFVATMADITEVNPLQPHYYCKECKYSDFESDVVISFLGSSGCDMPDKECPNCGTMLQKEGHDIPFETFLGFNGDKEPDIDLNFSGEYQAKAHAYTEELFGTGYVFKAGTIGTMAEKTAYGLVQKYIEKRDITLRKAEINSLRNGITGVKRTTGQHPGGLMVVPSDNSIYNFTPVQRPANLVDSKVITTHFDYHSISGRLLKLDILGHDVPTILKMLHDETGYDPTTVNIGDPEIMSLFTSPARLGVTEEQIRCNTGSLGLPEFGTNFVRQMLKDTKPNTFSELVRISGLSHGTDVWLNNGQDLVRDGVATLKEIIPTRDDIMVYLIIKGVDRSASFRIMESVRKGKGIAEADEKLLVEANIPEWYIESCKKIKYMFPKGHAVAYVMMTVRIGYYKIHYPYAFYAAIFSVKADDFDYEVMCKGKDRVLSKMNEITALGRDATAKDKGTLTVLELIYEMYARGLKFVELDIYKSEARKFVVTPDGILPPLCTVPGFGGSAAENVVEARKEGEFMTIEDFRERTKVTKTVIEILKNNDLLKGLPETSQMSLF